LPVLDLLGKSHLARGSKWTVEGRSLWYNGHGHMSRLTMSLAWASKSTVAFGIVADGLRPEIRVGWPQWSESLAALGLTFPRHRTHIAGQRP
jgi:hypothetical protein